MLVIFLIWCDKLVYFRYQIAWIHCLEIFKWMIVDIVLFLSILM
jgi:hypothetical protein